jgi:hypothetical protein
MVSMWCSHGVAISPRPSSYLHIYIYIIYMHTHTHTHTHSTHTQTWREILAMNTAARPAAATPHAKPPRQQQQDAGRQDVLSSATGPSTTRCSTDVTTHQHQPGARPGRPCPVSARSGQPLPGERRFSPPFGEQRPERGLRGGGRGGLSRFKLIRLRHISLATFAAFGGAHNE